MKHTSLIHAPSTQIQHTYFRFSHWNRLWHTYSKQTYCYISFLTKEQRSLASCKRCSLVSLSWVLPSNSYAASHVLVPGCDLQIICLFASSSSKSPVLHLSPSIPSQMATISSSHPSPLCSPRSVISKPWLFFVSFPSSPLPFTLSLSICL